MSDPDPPERDRDAQILARIEVPDRRRVRAVAAAVRDNTGRVVIARGQTLSDAQILQMNWLAEGVQGQLPH